MEDEKLEYGNVFADRLFNSKTDEERKKLCNEFEGASDQEKKKATKSLIEFLKDDRDTREHNALRSWVPVMLGCLKTKEVYDVLIEQLQVEENDVVLKWIVSVLVSEFEDEERFEHIYKKYQEEKERIIFARQIIVEEIAGHAIKSKYIGPFGVQILKEAISDPYAEGRTPAINALGEVRERSAVPEMTELLISDSDGDQSEILPSERRQIIEALAKIGEASALETIINIAKNDKEERNVRVSAVNALGTLGKKVHGNEEEKITKTLVKLTSSPEPLISHTATASLRTFLSEESAAKELAEYGLEAEESELSHLANAIRMVDTETAVKRLDEEDGELKERAEKLITETGGEYAIEILNDRKTVKNTQRLVDWLAFGLVVVSTIFFLIAWFADSGHWLIDLKFWSVAFIIIVFLASVLVAFPARTVVKPLRYLSSILLAFLFTAGMLAVLSIGLSQLNKSESTDLASFGPMTVFQHQDSSRVQTERQWAVSFSAGFAKNESESEVADTSGTPAATGENNNTSPTNGFWAPVWVLFLATLGSGILTVSLIVQEISNRPQFSDQTKMRNRLGQILQHQFFILFAPIGGIFVYQGLISVGAAGKTMTVALAALGAGASLNFLLKRAVKASKKALSNA
jgi:HEAT repeat protein